jgi:hypothetical protein
MELSNAGVKQLQLKRCTRSARGKAVAGLQGCVVFCVEGVGVFLERRTTGMKQLQLKAVCANCKRYGNVKILLASWWLLYARRQGICLWRCDTTAALSIAGAKQLQPKDVYAKCKRYGICKGCSAVSVAVLGVLGWL